MIRYGIILFIICFCASLVLSLTYQFTNSQIQAQLVSQQTSALDDIFTEATKFDEKIAGETTYYLAKQGSRGLGYIIKTEAKGYSGLISMLVGFDFNGEIKGIKILSHTETPGLGAKINEIRSGEDRPWFLRQFEGKHGRQLELTKNIQAITAATISSRAVLEAVKRDVTEFISRVKRND